MLFAMARRQAKIPPSQIELQSSPPSGSSSGIKEELPGGLKGQRTSAEFEQPSKSPRKPPGHKFGEPWSPEAGGGEAGGEKLTGEDRSGAQLKLTGGEERFAAVEGTRRVGGAAMQGGSKNVESLQEASQEAPVSALLRCPTCAGEFRMQAQLNEHMRMHAVAPPTKTFGCVCGKFFATYRGLSKHWDYEPGHRPSNLPRKQPFPPPAAPAASAPPPSDPPTSCSEPTSPLVSDASPLRSPTSTPSSPVYLKSLGRNLSYFSIIRTRQSSNTDPGVGPVKVGSKRQRGAVGPPSNPPVKAMQLNTGEKVAVGDSPESRDGSEGAMHAKKKEKEQSKKEVYGSGRPRTRSLSGSDNTPPPSMRGSLSAADLVRSPMTRSSSAAMRTVEFVSLPSRKKRRRRTGTGESQLDESPTSEEATTPIASGMKKMKVEEHPDRKMKVEERPERRMNAEERPKPKMKTEERPKPKVQEELPPQQLQPVKRKRGRPPKIRKDPPPPPPITSPSSSTPGTSTTSSPLAMASQQTIVTSTTSSLGSITSPSVGREPPMEAKAPAQPIEETPLPSSSLEGSLPPERHLPLWDSIGDTSQPASIKSEHLSTQLQALLSQHPDTKSQGSDPPELPFVHPSIIPPTSTNSPPVIPSILPQLKFKSEHSTSLSAALPTQPSADAGMSSPTSLQYTYVVSSKESKMVTVKSMPPMAFAGGETTSSDSKVLKKGKPDSKPPKEESDEEPEVIAVEPAASVPIDLTKDDRPEELQGKRKRLPSKAAQKQVVQKEGREKGKEEAASTGEDTDKRTETKSSDDGKEAAEAKEKERSTATQRPPSVIVSVLSGSEKGEKKVDEKPTSSSDANSDKTPEMEPEAKKPEARRKLSMTEPSLPMPYSLASTPTYVPSSYPYPGPFPPPPVMFPPPGSPTSSMYPPYYGGYPPPMPPGPYMHPPPMGMMPHPPLPPSQQGGTSQPHAMPSPFTPATSSQLSSITTVGGVRVSVLDKPPMQMPTVTVPPLQISPGRSRSSPNTFTTHMDHTSQGSMGSSSVIKSFMSTTSPEGMDMSHPPHSHPLSQAYRLPPGPPPSGYMPPPPQQPYVSVRIDPSGMPYVDWGAPPPPPHIPSDVKPKLEHSKPQPEEVPSQPVECPECGRLFKNNKALNGHMRLHGGFDWTKKPFTCIPDLASVGESGAGKAPRASNSNGSSNEEGYSEKEEKRLKPKKHKSGVGKKRSRSRSSSPNNKKLRRKSSDDSIPEQLPQTTKGKGAVPLPVPRGPNVFTFDTRVDNRGGPPVATGATGMHDAGTMTQHRSATLDDLCRAVEELERMENGQKEKQKDKELEEDSDDSSKRRPGNIRIPQSYSSPILEKERHRFGVTPPYTPPPILSPSRSMTMLGGLGTPNTPQPCTPHRILQSWSSRRSSDNRRPSESDESYTEPRINIGKEFQAVLPEYRASHSNGSPDQHEMVKVWQPLAGASHEDESVVDGYMELVCSPAVLHAGRNKEFAMHLLHQLGGSVKEAVRLLLAGKSPFSPASEMASYNYCGTKQWTARERQQFRRAWRVHRKQFQLLRSVMDSKKYHEIIEYYYSWKKYCNDEYRGRNRHLSEDILTDEDSHINSDTSSSGSAENDPPPLHLLASESEKAEKLKTSEKRRLTPQPPSSHPPHPLPPRPLSSGYEHLPIVYAAHSSQPKQTVHQYKCKYPGCNQVFTSIFALNGHIRIHGGSFYPKPSKMESSSSQHTFTSRTIVSTVPSHSSTPSSIPPSSSQYTHPSAMTMSAAAQLGHKLEYRSQQQLELARTLLELPQPRSPARSTGYHTPSPKPSPGSKTKSPGKKKMSSSSPGEHEGYYPCNRCGRVFGKVKSRSAHMKSHIIKQT